jgi:hypothetical protein
VSAGPSRGLGPACSGRRDSSNSVTDVLEVASLFSSAVNTVCLRPVGSSSDVNSKTSPVGVVKSKGILQVVRGREQ